LNKKSLLLHACCAPCSCYVVELLKNDFDITLFYYNPNISPLKEYIRRLAELERFAGEKNIPLLTGERDLREWVAVVRDTMYLGERSVRCRTCYRFRLERTFRKAREDGYNVVSTVLSISPHKDAGKINEAGKELEKKYGIMFLEGDFKKQDGFRKASELSAFYGFYRQNYCGCAYSKLEREKNPYWMKKVAENGTYRKW